MNTEKAHERFWEAMRARFGKRWLDEFGDKPTAPWVQLLNQHTPTQIRKGLELMGQERLQHPPTLPQFEVFLRRATTYAPAQEINWQRGYWRSVIVASLSHRLRETSPTLTDDDIEDYVIEHRGTVGTQLRELLDELCDIEGVNNGQRTAGMYTRIADRVRQVVALRATGMAA